MDLPLNWDSQLALKVPELNINVTDRIEIGSQYKNTRFAGKIKQVFSDSAKLNLNEMSLTLFDMVFIDGCHHYIYVKNDTQNAMRNLKSGGIIIWHDYGMIKGVSKAVDEIAKIIKVKAIRGTRLAVGFID